MKKQIAWGTSKLLKMYLLRTRQQPFAYCIDDFTDNQSIYGVAVRRSRVLEDETRGTFQIVVFAVSSKSLQAIFQNLYARGFQYGREFILYSDFFYDAFVAKSNAVLGWQLDPRIYRYAVSYTLNSITSIHTTILGTWMILEILKQVQSSNGHLAEVGMFQGGNALCCLNFLTCQTHKRMYLFDSFEGFPELSKFDPQSVGKGDYKIEVPLEEVLGKFSIFPEAHLIKGFVPETFSNVPSDEQFDFVFYDCDLYQPAMDTFSFFWEKILPGGFVVVHDYETEEGGFTGVKQAVTDFFIPRNVPVVSFFENTIAIIRK